MEMLADLINLAQGMLDTGFDSQLFQDWEFLAFLALLASLGPFHYYTQNFKRLTSEKNQQSLLVGEGILVAARETLSQERVSRPAKNPIHVDVPVGMPVSSSGYKQSCANLFPKNANRSP